VGIGWNPVEYEALGHDFHTRGRRIEEQVALLRRLWTEPLVTAHGRWDQVVAAGLNPLPVQRPIPVWFGGQADPVLRRTARLGDGWMPTWRTPAEAQPDLDKLWAYLAEAGRDRSTFGIEARIPYGEPDAARWTRLLEGWRAAGATHASVNTMGAGLATPRAHVEALMRFAESAGMQASGAPE
jgi:alkanesulfonate monooxygenase SsuD/methylene tetrahydromethanopterin reductase-like flavin-dependent oxidoreductase (luciferase family)